MQRDCSIQDIVCRERLRGAPRVGYLFHKTDIMYVFFFDSHIFLQASTDFPASIFWEELTKVFPDALVVHTERSSSEVHEQAT